MARHKEFDEQEVLGKAVELFWSQGFEATSISDLERQLGLGRQSIYNAFGDKHQLYVKALEQYADRNFRLVQNVLHAPDAGMEAVRRYFEALVAFLTPKGERKACLLLNSSLERGSRDLDVTRACAKNQQAVISGFTNTLTNAVEKGELGSQIDIEATARMLMAQVYGLSVLAKSGASTRELRQTADALLDRLV